MSERERSTESTGNIFEDLGFNRAEATTMLVRARLMLALARELRGMAKTQTELAGILGIGQSRVSDLIKGKAKLFSLDMLLSLAQRIGMRVTLAVQPRGSGPEVGASPGVAASAFRRVVSASATPDEVHATPWGTATRIIVSEAREDSVGTGPTRVHSSATVVGVPRYRSDQSRSTESRQLARRAA